MKPDFSKIVFDAFQPAAPSGVKKKSWTSAEGIALPPACTADLADGLVHETAAGTVCL